MFMDFSIITTFNKTLPVKLKYHFFFLEEKAYYESVSDLIRTLWGKKLKNISSDYSSYLVFDSILMVLKANREDQSVVLGPVVQSISLTSFSVVKMLTVLVSTISNSHIFLLKKCEQLLQMQKLLTFFQQNK